MHQSNMILELHSFTLGKYLKREKAMEIVEGFSPSFLLMSQAI